MPCVADSSIADASACSRTSPLLRRCPSFSHLIASPMEKLCTNQISDSTSPLVDFHTGVYASAVPARAASSAISSLLAIAVDSSPVVAVSMEPRE